MEVCPMCKGSGWTIVKKSTPRSRALYGNDVLLDYAEPCPHCNGANERKVEDIRTRANIPATFYDASIENFKWNVYLDRNERVIDLTKQRQFVESFIKDFPKWQERGIGFYIYSKIRGSGKTFLASCICNSLMVKYQISTKFVSASSLIDLSKQDTGGKNPIDVLCECSLLVLDDIGQKTTGEEWQNDLLFKIIDTRYQKKLITLFTSNVKCAELRVDDRVSSRIDKITQEIPLPEYSFRSKAAFDEKSDFYKEIGLL